MGHQKIFLQILIGLLSLCTLTNNAVALPLSACKKEIVLRTDNFDDCLTLESKSIARIEVLKRIARGSALKAAGGFDPTYYPFETILAVLRARTQDNKNLIDPWISASVSKFESVLQEDNYFLVHPTRNGNKDFGENTQSRLVLALAEIYEIYPKQKIRDLLVRTFLSLDALPLLLVESSKTKKKYSLPAYMYTNTSKPKPNSYRTLDPNHEATLAAAYWKVSNLKILSKGKSNVARIKATRYFDAGLDLHTDNECLPLADQPIFVEACDTRYNAFWLHWMLKLQPFLGDEKSLLKLKNQYSTIKRPIREFSTNRVYPQIYKGPYPNPVEPNTLLIAVAMFGSQADFDAFVKKINSFYLSNRENTQNWPINFLFA